MPENKISTVIIGKNQQGIDELISHLEKIKDISVVGTATSGNKGVSLVNGFAPKLLFVNVDLPDINGLEFVNVLHSRNIYPEVVFLAEDDKMAFKSMAYKPLDFLIKPFQHDDIEELVGRLKNKINRIELDRKMEIYSKSDTNFKKKVFQQKGGIVILRPDEIVFFKAEVSTTVLTLANGEIIKIKTGLNETLETINSSGFFKVNRSYCINRKYLRKIDKKRNKCSLYSEGQTWGIPVSKSAIDKLEKLVTSSIF